MSATSMTVLSLCFLTASVYLFCRYPQKSKLFAVVFIFCLSISYISHVIFWVSNYFTGDGVNDAVIFHVKFGLQGAGWFEYFWIIFLTCFLSVFYIYIIIKISKTRKKYKRYTYNNYIFCLTIFILFISYMFNPVGINLYELYTKEKYLCTYERKSDDFNIYYKKPYIEEISGEKNKNLIFIYAESLERTYFDESIFPDLIKYIPQLKTQSISFLNIKQSVGSGWTIGGMVASQCGIPLFIPSHGNSMSGMDHFLSAATCLGDLLNKHGYYLSYFGGAHLDFAGKGKFYQTHGFHDVRGQDELLPTLSDQNYKSPWGIFDDTLLDIVYNNFIKLSEKNIPFGIFTLTLDTHHPNGHPSKSCNNIKYGDGSNPILNAVSCSDYLLYNFIKKIFDSPYGTNTIVILMSDHLAMRNSAFNTLNKNKNSRRNLFIIFDKSIIKSKIIKTSGSTIDIAPTILPLIGLVGDIGFGRNLLKEKGEGERDFIQKNMNKWKDNIIKFWDFPILTNFLSINIEKKFVNIDDRTFKIPVLIELNSKMESILKFQFHKDSSHKSLIQHVNELNNDKYFLLIDYCENINKLIETSSLSEFCLLIGQGEQFNSSIELTQNKIYSSIQIKNMLQID